MIINCLSVQSNSELSGYVRFRKPMAPNIQTGVHFRNALERLHLINTRFVLHSQLISCMHESEKASKHIQTTSIPYVPSWQAIALVLYFLDPLSHGLLETI